MMRVDHHDHSAPSHYGRGRFRVPGAGVRVPETLDLGALLTASQAALYVGLTVPAIVNWRDRGYRGEDGMIEHLPVAVDACGNEIRDAQGRPKYRLHDIIRADKATYERRRAA